jgi:sulfopyruvate decarboxylase TPP-binding subunit
MDLMEQVLTPTPIIEPFKKNGVTHVIWLPDSETNFMYELMTKEEELKIVPVCREGESMAIAAGVWVGGKKPVVLIQNTGMFEAGDSIRGLVIDIEFPLVMMIGYRGWTRHGITKDSAARFTEPILHAYGINYYLIESNDDVDRISEAFEEAERTRRPAACLLGAEYS